MAMTYLAARTPGRGPRARIDGQHEHAGQHDHKPPPPGAARSDAPAARPVLLPRSRPAPGRSRAPRYHHDPARWRTLDSNPTRQPAMLARPAARARPPHRQTRPNVSPHAAVRAPFTDQYAGPSDGTG